MKKRLVCLALVLGFCLGLCPVRAAGEDLALELTGTAGNAPYLAWGELTVTVEDYLEAVRDVGTGLLVACEQAEVPFMSSAKSIVWMPGVFSSRKAPTYFWDNTIDGVPFSEYLEHKSQVLSFYRAWESSDLAPVSTPETLAQWERQGGLHFQWYAQTDEEPVRQAYAQLCLDEGVEVEEYAMTPDELRPRVIQALKEAEAGVWTEPFYDDDPDFPYWATLKLLPVTAEEHRQILLKEAWPSVMETIVPRQVEGAPQLPPATELYELWLNWAMNQNGEVTIATTRWTTLPEEVAIAPAVKTKESIVYNLDFSDVSGEDWFAPYVQVCVENGILTGTGEGRFEPYRELSVAETVVLGARFLARMQVEEIPALPEDPFVMARFYAQDGTLLGDFRDRVQQPLSGAGSQYFTSFREEILEQVQGENITLILDLKALQPYIDSSQYPWSHLYKADISVPLCYEGVWDGECYRFDLGEDFGDYGPAFLLDLSSLIHLAAFLPEWFRDEFLYLFYMVGVNNDFLAGHDLEAMEAAAGIDDWVRGTPAQRDDLISLLREADDALGLEALEPPEYSLALLSQMDDQDLFVFRLYLAGVLTGVDETGSYSGEKTLTRAEAAAILGRIFEPGLRVENTNLDYEAIFGTE